MRCRLPAVLLAVSIILMLLFITSCVSGPEGPPPEKPVEEAPPEDVYESIGNYVITGDVTGAIEAFETLNRENPDDPETKNAYVKLLLAAGKLEEAAGIIDTILKEFPDNVGALFNAALLAGFTGGEEEREELLKRVVDLDPGHADAWALLGEIHMERKQYGKAEECFTAGLAADPDNLVSHSAMAQIRRINGDTAGALESLDRVLDIDPEFSFAWADRAAIKASGGDRDGAEADYSRAIELDPDYYWHYIDRAKLRIRSRRLEEALEDLDVAVKLDPGQFYGYILRAGVRDDLDRRAGAIDDYIAVIERRPDYYFAYEPLAVLLFMEERWTEAEESFLKAWPYNRDRYEFLLLADICSLKEGRPVKDRLYDHVHRIPRQDLLYHVGRVFLEPGYEHMAITKIQEEGKTSDGTRALFYLAEHFLLTGLEETALKYFFEIEERNLMGLIETRLAKAERIRLADFPE